MHTSVKITTEELFEIHNHIKVRKFYKKCALFVIFCCSFLFFVVLLHSCSVVYYHSAV